MGLDFGLDHVTEKIIFKFFINAFFTIKIKGVFDLFEVSSNLTRFKVGIVNWSGCIRYVIEAINHTLGTVCEEFLVLGFLGQGKTVLIILLKLNALDFEVLIVFRNENIKKFDLCFSQFALHAFEIDFGQDWEFTFLKSECLHTFFFRLFFINPLSLH